MNVRVIASDNFKREAKRLIKKYGSLKSEISDFIDALEKNPIQGTLITESVYKIRLAVKSKGKGKSGGARVITYIHIYQNEDGDILAYLLSIYDKSEIENMPEYIIKEMVTEIQANLSEDVPEKLDEDSISE